MFTKIVGAASDCAMQPHLLEGWMLMAERDGRVDWGVGDHSFPLLTVMKWKPWQLLLAGAIILAYERLSTKDVRANKAYPPQIFMAVESYMFM